MLNIYSTHKEKGLADLLAGIIDKSGCELVRVRISRYRNVKKCQIMIDKIDNTQVSLLDCENVNKIVLEILDKNDLGLQDYTIEISSPGIDRPLTRIKDFLENKNKLIKIKTLFKVLDRRSFKGYLNSINENSISIKIIDNNEIISIRFDSISEAYLQYVDNKN